MNSGKILVTGAAGYLGTHVTSILGADGSSRRLGRPLFSDELERVLPDYEAIVHLAALVDKRPEAAGDCFRMNADGTRWLAERLTAGQTLIFASTKDVYDRSCELYEAVPESCSTAFSGQNGYAWSKLLAERYAEFFADQNGFRLGIFRLATVFAAPSEGNPGGFVSGFARAIREGKRLTLRARGLQVRDVLPVEELARAFDLFLKSGLRRETFNIGGGLGNALTFAELSERIGLANRQPVSVELSDQPVPSGDQLRFVADVQKLKEKLGWEPVFDLNASLANA
jgi:CDP-paratose 2-epimerase